MKAIFDFIYKEVGTILGVLKGADGKYSWKRVTGAVALVAGVDFLFRGGLVEALIALGYCAVVAIVAAVTKT